MPCPHCGHQTASDDRFCGACGAPLAFRDAEGVDHTSVISPGPPTGTGPISDLTAARLADLPDGGAMLVVHRGPGEGQEHLLDPSVGVLRIGRSPEADVFLDDVTVSRHHAELRHGAEGWSIRDIGSLNGTYVNRVRVDDEQLAGGSEVQIGKFRFVFLAGPDQVS